jgi:hypothetical protein
LPYATSHNGGVIAGHSRPKDGVASLAYDPAIHERARLKAVLRKTSAVEAGSWITGSRRHSASKTRVNALVAAAR